MPFIVTRRFLIIYLREVSNVFSLMQKLVVYLNSSIHSLTAIVNDVNAFKKKK